MARNVLAVLCTLLSLVASPDWVMGEAFDAVFGASGCCDTSCCCADTPGCAAGELAAPRMVSGCRCGHKDRDSVKAAPQSPRSCGGEAAELPAPRPVAVECGQPPRTADDRRPVPELPPPRRPA